MKRLAPLLRVLPVLLVAMAIPAFRWYRSVASLGGSAALDDANARLILLVKPDAPRHPPLNLASNDPAEAAAVRLLKVLADVDAELGNASGWVMDDLTIFGTDPVFDDAPPPEEVARGLQAAQEWIGRLLAALSAERIELRMLDQAVVLPLAEDDPRRGLLTRARAAARILKADAIRLWAAGDRAAAAERAAGIVHLADLLGDEPPLLLHALVAESVLGLGASLIEAMNAAGLNEASRPILAAAGNRLEPEDPVGLRFAALRCVGRTRETIGRDLASDGLSPESWYLLSTVQAGEAVAGRMFEGLTGGKPLDEAYRDAVRNAPVQAALGMASVSEADVRVAYERGLEFAERLKDAWGTPEAARIAAEIRAWDKSDATGVAGLMFTGIENVERSWREARERAAALRSLQTRGR